jgi:hypothetical protein
VGPLIDINEGVKSATSDKAIKTASFLVGAYYDFGSDLKLNLGGYKFDKAVIRDVARRYVYDVDRLHRFHGIKFIDRHKIAGYLSYWICKLRPISVKTPDIYFENAKTPLYINEAYALYVAIGRINAHYAYNKSGEKMVLSKGLVDALLYGLRYRSATGDMLSLSYYLMEKNSKR